MEERRSAKENKKERNRGKRRWVGRGMHGRKNEIPTNHVEIRDQLYERYDRRTLKLLKEGGKRGNKRLATKEKQGSRR